MRSVAWAGYGDDLVVGVGVGVGVGMGMGMGDGRCPRRTSPAAALIDASGSPPLATDKMA
ncbi:hypothetical protein [Dactylosporangium sp. NPDC049140]|uniref:hypothetical protein n=1 Tax=Dactylosporangium sp. NPDC049140 TaxID=3155647 RepID=UPI0033C77797